MGGPTTCDACGLNYCTDARKDVRFHSRYHGSWVEASRFLGCIRTGEEIETSKSRAWSAIRHAGDASEQLEALEAIVRAHFERSARGALGSPNWRKHPEYSEYCSVYENEQLAVLYPASWREFVGRYGRKSNARMPSGHTHWDTK